MSNIVVTNNGIDSDPDFKIILQDGTEKIIKAGECIGLDIDVPFKGEKV